MPVKTATQNMTSERSEQVEDGFLTSLTACPTIIWGDICEEGFVQSFPAAITKTLEAAGIVADSRVAFVGVRRSTVDSSGANLVRRASVGLSVMVMGLTLQALPAVGDEDAIQAHLIEIRPQASPRDAQTIENLGTGVAVGFAVTWHSTNNLLAAPAGRGWDVAVSRTGVLLGGLHLPPRDI
eukprot:982016-Amphidinium_carterae.1